MSLCVFTQPCKDFFILFCKRESASQSMNFDAFGRCLFC